MLKLEIFNLLLIKFFWEINFLPTKLYISIDETYHDIDADWNKYIFHLDNKDDVRQKSYQEDNDVWDYASSEATDYLQRNNLIAQTEKGWVNLGNKK